MARGSVVGEKIVSQASTPEFEATLDRIYGPDRAPQRGRWVWDEAQQKLVRAEDYRPQTKALHAPIMMDRFYENTKATDGADIGSRRKHRAYMKEHGLAPADDYKGEWARAQARRDAAAQGQVPDKTRREALERAMYQLDKP
jgi:hypothetical protein